MYHSQSPEAFFAHIPGIKMKQCVMAHVYMGPLVDLISTSIKTKHSGHLLTACINMHKFDQMVLLLTTKTVKLCTTKISEYTVQYNVS